MNVWFWTVSLASAGAIWAAERANHPTVAAVLALLMIVLFLYMDQSNVTMNLEYLSKGEIPDGIAFNSNFSKEITATDMENAETILITKAQWETFPDEMTELSLKQTVDKSSSIRKLTPFLDQDGTMKSEKRTIWS